MLADKDIENIVSFELANSALADSGMLQTSLAAYLGDAPTVPEGRSAVVSTDIADAIEWILPEVMKAFTQNSEVVTFDPVGKDDGVQAELESRFVYDILMKDNNGFLLLYEFVKDALIQKNGFLKVFYSDDTEIKVDRFTGLTEPEYNMVISDHDVEVLEESKEMDESNTIPLFNIKIKKTSKKPRIHVVCVPPEEMRVNNMHGSLDLASARFTAHLLLKTRSDLILEGYDKDIVDELPANTNVSYDVASGQYRFMEMGENTHDDTRDKSQDLIEIAECYMRIDIDEDGISEMCKITVAGWSEATYLDYEEIDSGPFISGTAIIMPHKLMGMSIYDRLIQIQNQKTALWRNILDNMYLQNNQRLGVIENMVNLDDLMISRPGGIIRMKTAEAVFPIVTPPLSAEAYKMMDYLDQTRAGRVGVSPEGTITDSMMGDALGSEGIEKIMNQKEELVGLMIRVIAETAIKPLMYKIRDQLVKHQDVLYDYEFRGEWVKVNPKHWQSRKHTTVRVGTGSGNRKQQMGTLTGLLQHQMAISQRPGQTLVTPQQEFNLINDLVKLGGFPGADAYFLDPASPNGDKNAKAVGQQMQQEKQKKDMMDMQLLQAQVKVANAEESKAQTAAQNAMLKNEVEKGKNLLTLQKQAADDQINNLEQQLESLKAILEQRQKDAELQFKYYQLAKQEETKRQQIAATAQAAKDNNANKAKENG